MRKTININDQHHAALVRWLESDVENFNALVIGLLYAAMGCSRFGNTDSKPDLVEWEGDNLVLPNDDPIDGILDYLNGL